MSVIISKRGEKFFACIIRQAFCFAKQGELYESIGIYVDNLTGEVTYQSFKPNPLPPMPEVEMDEEIVKLDTASQLISNADLFISMYVRKEALISSQIEGIQYALKRLERLSLCCD